MGVKVYWILVAVIFIFGMIMPQQGQRKKNYVILMALIHAFVCGFRYQFLVGDLQKYHNSFISYMSYDYLSDEVFGEGRNAGWIWLEKLVADLTNGDFQIFLIILAIITQIIIAVLIYRYSPRPWFSYIVFDCMSFFVSYDLCAIKQGLAMSILMLAMMAIFERKPIMFLFLVSLAGFVHAPAFCFLPAYWLTKQKINGRAILLYLGAAVIIFFFRTSIANFFGNLYYESDDTIFVLESTTLGGRFMVIALMLLCGFSLKGFREVNFEILFNVIIVAAIFQMFSNFNNIFTRLADYYLQFTILYIPMIFYEPEGEVAIHQLYYEPILTFNAKSLRILSYLVMLVLIWWYWKTCIGHKITYAPDDYTNFRFMWEVAEETAEKAVTSVTVTLG